MTVEFLICTIDKGIAQIPGVLMPPMPGVTYLVSWQHSGDARIEKNKSACQKINDPIQKFDMPRILTERMDVRVVELSGRGLSRNRNNALRHAQGDLLVIADDDCRYTPRSVDLIRETFVRHPDAAAMQFRGALPDGRLCRNYPALRYEYRRRPRNAYVSSCELVLRRKADLPFFDERFGLGAYLGCGEEDVFVHTLSQRGLSVYYEPQVLVTTPGGTTGTRFATLPAVQRAKGGVLALIHGSFGAMLRCLKFAVVYPGVSVSARVHFFIEMLKGIHYVHSHHSLP